MLWEASNLTTTTDNSWGMKLRDRLKMRKGPTASIAMRKESVDEWRISLFPSSFMSSLPFQRTQFFFPLASGSSSSSGKNPVMALGRDINIPSAILIPSAYSSSSSATWFWHENRGRALGQRQTASKKVVSAVQQQRLLI